MSLFACKRSASASVISSQAVNTSRRGGTTCTYLIRNSLLTSILRNLGGNCRTAFIVNINPELEFVEETLATWLHRLSSMAGGCNAEQEINIRALVKKLRMSASTVKTGRQCINSGCGAALDRAIEMGQLRSAAIVLRLMIPNRIFP